jgi:hypothetical protein
VTAYVPARFGTPLMTPSAPTFSPGGTPDGDDHVYGVWPPFAISVERNATPTSATVRDAAALSATTSIVNCLESVRVMLSESLDVAVIVNVNEPAAVGVPEIAPSFPSDKPAGSAPSETFHVTTVVG